LKKFPAHYEYENAKDGWSRCALTSYNGGGIGLRRKFCGRGTPELAEGADGGPDGGLWADFARDKSRVGE